MLPLFFAGAAACHCFRQSPRAVAPEPTPPFLRRFRGYATLLFLPLYAAVDDSR